MNTLTFQTLLTFQQLRDLLLQLDDSAYQLQHPCFFGGSVGKHTRHILEFYQQLLEETPVVNYDERKRTPGLETSIQSALDVLDPLARYVSTSCDDRLLMIDADVFSDALPTQSSLRRELFYAYEHMVHHLALIRVGAFSAFPQLIFPPDFGVAYSTQKQRQLCAQ